MASIDEQIAANNNRISSLNAQISDANASASSWQADGDNDSCNQVLKAKKNACLSEKQRKITVANDIRNSIPALQAMITNLQADNKELTKQRVSEGQAIVNLSTQGLTMAAVKARADADAQAVVQIAGANANAIEKVADVNANQAAMDGKTKTAITIVVVVFVVIIMALLTYKKFKKQ